MDNIASKTVFFNQYNKQLLHYLVPATANFINRLYKKQKKRVDEDGIIGENAALVHLQYKLRDVPKWNDDQVEGARVIIEQSFTNKMPLSKTIKYLFSNQSQILASINPDDSELTVNIPDTNKFIHRVLKILSERLYKDHDLLYVIKAGQFNGVSGEGKRMVEGAIQSAFYELLPAGAIMDKYMANTKPKAIEDVKESGEKQDGEVESDFTDDSDSEEEGSGYEALSGEEQSGSEEENSQGETSQDEFGSSEHSGSSSESEDDEDGDDGWSKGEDSDAAGFEKEELGNKQIAK